MPRFRKRPVEIEAVRFTGNFDEVERFVGGDAEFRNGELVVATLEGPLRASPGDWIIKGVEGEFYPCKPDIFAKTYESADRPSASDRLAALEAAGVDNWEGYGHAMAVLRGEEDEDW